MANEKIIVTGGMGYIGSHTVVELIEAGFNPIIVDDLSNSKEEVLLGIKEITGHDVPFVKLDITKKTALEDFFAKHKDASSVIHFAAFKAVGESVTKPLEYYHNNVGGLINLLEVMQRFNINNLIFSSSCTVYGQPEKLPVTEQTPFSPAWSPYGETKQIGEKLLKSQTKADQSLNVISLRYFNPIGAHRSAKIGELPQGIPNNLLPYLTQTVVGIRKELSVYGGDYNTSDGTAVRDYIHVVDLAKAHVTACHRLVEKNQLQNFEAYNLGTGNGNTVLEVISSFERATGQKVNYKIVERRPGDIEKIYADTQHASKVLGWKTELSLDEMTASAWAWEQTMNKK